MNLTIDGYNIAYKITGGGSDTGSMSARDTGNDIPTAVILQGWGTSYDLYDSVASAIADRYRVVQFDLPGFGDSDEPEEAWNVDAYSDFFCKFMQELGISKAVLIGHSYGSRIIIKLAARDDLPFEIDKIVIIDGAGVVPERSLSMRLKVKKFRAIRKFLTWKPVYALFPEVIDYWLSCQGSDDYRNSSPVMKKCLVMAVNEDLKHLMPEVKQEVLLVWGDADTATPIGDAHIMEEKMPNAGLAIFEGAGHYSFLEQPVLFRNVIRTFLTGGDDA
jgi:pimeloyl-ACP methyl ester carboxylesterase